MKRESYYFCGYFTRKLLLNVGSTFITFAENMDGIL
jgi:hypothetical protein